MAAALVAGSRRWQPRLSAAINAAFQALHCGRHKCRPYSASALLNWFMLPERKHARLAQYDYALPGAYFITICTSQRRMSLGSIRHGEVQLSRLGELLAKHWLALPQRHTGCIRLDQWVIMPNHFHAVLLILSPSSGTTKRAPALGRIVGPFKAGVTRDWNALLEHPGAPVFQDGYYDHVVRHEHALERIREYIMSNPRQWTIDRENPKRSGDNEFYRWLEAYCRKSTPAL